MRRLSMIVFIACAMFLASETHAQTLTQSGPCPGVKTFEVTGALPFSRLAYIYSLSTGSWTIPPPYPCAGTPTLLGPPVFLRRWVEADASGFGTISVWLPAGWCGTRYIQVVDTLGCTTTNMITVS